jgi:hypothetical protein
MQVIKEPDLTALRNSKTSPNMCTLSYHMDEFDKNKQPNTFAGLTLS